MYKIPFKERHVSICLTNEDSTPEDFAKRFNIPNNSLGVVDICTYQGEIRLKIEPDAKINRQIKSIIRTSVMNCAGVGDLEARITSDLQTLGITASVHVENAIQEMYALSNKQLSQPNIMRGTKKSLVIHDEPEQEPEQA